MPYQILCDNESWKITSQMQTRLTTTGIWFYRKIMWIPWTGHVGNENVLRQMKKNQLYIKSVEISGPYNEKRRSVKFGIHRRYWRERKSCIAPQGQPMCLWLIFCFGSLARYLVPDVYAYSSPFLPSSSFGDVVFHLLC